MPNKGGGDYHLSLLDEALLYNKVNVLFPGKFKFFFFLPISRKIKATKVNIVHIHWIHGFAGFVAKNFVFSIVKFILFAFDIIFLKRILKTKVVWTVNNLYSHEKIYPKLEKLGRRFFAQKSDAIICHCYRAKDLITKEFKISTEKIHVIPMGNYTKYYKNFISKDDARNKLSFPQDAFIFLHFGRVKEYKGIDFLIKSFQKINRNEDIKLLIVGSLPDKQYGIYLKKIAEINKNIHFFFRYVSDDKIQQYMNASDIVVTSYKEILNSGEIILALGFGKPIIAPDIGCISEIIDNDGSFLYNSNEKNALEKALEDGINNKDNLEKMGTHNLKLAEKLDWKVVGEKTKQIYQNLLN